MASMSTHWNMTIFSSEPFISMGFAPTFSETLGLTNSHQQHHTFGAPDVGWIYPSLRALPLPVVTDFLGHGGLDHCPLTIETGPEISSFWQHWGNSWKFINKFMFYCLAWIKYVECIRKHFPMKNKCMVSKWSRVSGLSGLPRIKKHHKLWIVWIVEWLWKKIRLSQICMCMYIYIVTHIHVYTYTCIHIYTYLYIYAYMHIFIYAYLYMCLFIYICVHICI